MQGSTDEECCETKFCSAWTCSDATKWVTLSDQWEHLCQSLALWDHFHPNYDRALHLLDVSDVLDVSM